MKQNNLEDLIDAFLKGSINEHDRRSVMLRVENDPEAKELLEDSIETYKFLQFARDEKIRKQLREYDKMNRTTAGISYKHFVLLGCACVFLICFSWLGLVSYFQPDTIAKRNIETEPFDSSSGRADVEFSNWILAKKYIDVNDFQNAARLFQPISENANSAYRHHARWNVLMCHLASEGPSPRWQNDFNRFLSMAPAPLRSKGDRLLNVFDSLIYKMLIPGPSKYFSTLKPRLI